MDMLSWLRQQIETRKALAESASPWPWSANAEHDEVLAVDGERVADGFALSGNQLRNTVDHIVFNDPQQIIADCKAAMAILEECAKYFGGEHHELMWRASNLARRVVADLAKAYGWTPERTASCPS
ncbi:DUF6221 family protein [Nonomuraea sp. CA-218870]|uniref:DUF6221 family protein n=1 Tax=Nonomuraea sp. CA-218870 TaxID=3239998 RepID=UPI003D909CA3